jgi:hypothetical protein
MFIEFTDKDGDTLRLNINQIVGFEFKVGVNTLVELTTGRVARVRNDEAEIQSWFGELHRATGLNLFPVFTPVESLTEEQFNAVKANFESGHSGSHPTGVVFPVVPSP